MASSVEEGQHHLEAHWAVHSVEPCSPSERACSWGYSHAPGPVKLEAEAALVAAVRRSEAVRGRDHGESARDQAVGLDDRHRHTVSSEPLREDWAGEAWEVQGLERARLFGHMGWAAAEG